MHKENLIYILYIIHTHERILFGHQKGNIVPLATTYMDLEDITLSEISQTEKKEYCMISFICGI